MDALAARLAAEPELAGAYTEALDRFLRSAARTSTRARASVLDDVGLGRRADAEVAPLSGGEAARAALAAILLARFDVFLLDEPTNNLDFAGLERLERFLDGLAAGVVLVSHDREFLDRTMTRVVEIEAETRRVHEYAGTWSRLRGGARPGARPARGRLRRLSSASATAYTTLLATAPPGADARRRANGAQTGVRPAGDERAARKVAQAKHHLERLEEVEKPWSPWRLQLEFAAAPPAGSIAELDGAVVELGSSRLGPVDLELGYGDRLAIVGRERRRARRR